MKVRTTLSQRTLRPYLRTESPTSNLPLKRSYGNVHVRDHDMNRTYAIGVDYGTSSVRAVVTDCLDGRLVGTSVFAYPSGEHGILLDPRDPHLARQNPADYLEGLRASVSGALDAAEREPEFSRDCVVGIGADTTGSTPLPVDAQNKPLALDPRWRANLAAHAWLWKDHTAAPRRIRCSCRSMRMCSAIRCTSPAHRKRRRSARRCRRRSRPEPQRADTMGSTPLRPA